ncbi:GNAT family N-acetyltransferase [Reyranella soli]|uniref:N-acetyltransferase n=1 Tax=Reyranella soli TaxID=1230389 RepID=A0A512NGI4_9HYPH|nr:GNAT family N-acetyltransferase [Reyranella soli]GEP58064.1 N-acetyltransferase [Reyranella soli]
MLSPSSDLSQVRRLEELAFAGWPALETRDVAGWRLRFSGGYTKRANSINALERKAQTDLKTVEGLESAYRELGQLPAWRLSPLAPAAIAEVLAARGYRAIERSLVQVCPLRAFTPAPEVRIHAQPTESWIEAFSAHSPVRPEHRAAMRRMLAAIAAPVGFAFVEEAGQPMAMAIGAVNGDHMGLFDVLVMPQARRRGLARKVTESLYAWAWDHGARFAYLQVVATNAAAMPLYEAQGFRTVYDYEYIVPPT